MTHLSGWIVAIGNREERDCRLPLEVSCWIRVEFAIQLGIPRKLPLYGRVDLRISEEAFAMVSRRFLAKTDQPHVSVEFDENHYVTFLHLRDSGEPCEHRTVEAMVQEANR